MPELSAEKLIKRHDRAWGDLAQWRGQYRDAYRYTQAARDTVDNPTPGQPRASHVFDSQAGKSLSRSTNRLQDLLFPSGKNFFELRPGPAFDSVPEEEKEQVAETLQDITKKFHAAIWASNFETAINEALADLMVGTAALLFNEGDDDQPFHFSAWPQFALGFGEGPNGTIGDVSREVSMLPSIAQKEWPDAEISDEQTKEATDGKEQKRAYIEITYPDDDSFSVLPGGDIGRPTKWFYAVIDKKDKRQILKAQRAFETASPWIVTRYKKATNEIRGRGPVFDALPDIRTLNKVVELVLMNASIATSGVWTGIDDNVFNTNMSLFQPGSVITVGSNSTENPTLRPLEFPGSFDVSQLLLSDYRSQIRQALFDEDLPDVNDGVRSATEIIERRQRQIKDFGPAAGRIQKELLEPLVLRGIHILRRKGLVNIPKALRIDGQFINIQIVSPLAQLQNLDDIQKVLQAIELSQAAVGPELTQLNFKVEEVPKFIAEQMGVPQDLVRNKDEKQKGLDTVMRMMAQQAQPTAEEGG
ncbi:hypothetical protein HBA54_03195 [Pelagibius litoralis]|uniref:Bacteriophage head to tail connecting protein n=1 Tax=Pelagibius litoralis TaxID=374515 RepID=A0A967CAC6_9PROT|nr:portal protein [Pelagibius litoralis]NIA67588.1 hypothetical protein [Pelagibius litoralis]